MCQQLSEGGLMKEIVVSNGLYPIITQALEEMKSEQGDSFRLEEVNLSELERRTGISRAKLRRLKKDGFKSVNRSKRRENLFWMATLLLLIIC